MDEFESIGNLMPGGRKKHEKGPRSRVVEGGAPYASSDIYLPDVRGDEQLEKPGDGVIPFSHPSRLPAGVQADLHSLAYGVCPKCNGAGWLRRDVPYGHPDFGKDFPCVCKERELREKRQRKMIALSEQFGFQRAKGLSTFRRQVKGVQEAYQEATVMIEHLQAWAGQRAVAKQAKNGPPPPQEWLVFRGPVGAGKTHLAMAITNACIDAGIVALFATVPDLLDYLRATYRPEATAAYDDVFERLKNSELLVLDDLGVQLSKPWADEKIFQLINYRYNFGWPTVITLNKKAWTHLDERISSRLQDADLVRLVDLENAQDYRLRQGKNTTRRHAQSTESSVSSEL